MATVLLVEDHEDTRELYTLNLKVQGFVVRSAHSAARALELLAEEKPDVIVTDISMPDMDGVELCHRIRAMPHLRGVPVLAVTGHSSEATLAAVSAAGACALCPKPLSGAALVTAIRSLLAERSTCLACWEGRTRFKQVAFGDRSPGWMRHEPVDPED